MALITNAKNVRLAGNLHFPFITDSFYKSEEKRFRWHFPTDILKNDSCLADFVPITLKSLL